MASLRTMLSRTNINIDKAILEQFTSDIQEVMQLLDRPGLHNQFRDDILKIMSTSVDLAKTLSSPSFSVDEVLSNLSFLSARIGLILDYAAKSRPRTQGWGLVHKLSGRVAPTIYLDKQEADNYVEQLRALGMLSPDLELRRVEIVSSSIQAPSAQVLAATPPPPAVQHVQPQVEEIAELNHALEITDPSLETNSLPQILQQLKKEQEAEAEAFTAMQKTVEENNSNGTRIPDTPAGDTGYDPTKPISKTNRPQERTTAPTPRDPLGR